MLPYKEYMQGKIEHTLKAPERWKALQQIRQNPEHLKQIKLNECNQHEGHKKSFLDRKGTRKQLAVHLAGGS
jgi:hypothetical protein